MDATTLTSTNPANGEMLASYPVHTIEQVDQLLAETDRAQVIWRTSGFETRTAVVEAAAEQFPSSAGELAELMASEIGKSVADGRAEAEKCALVGSYYADHGEAMMEDHGSADPS